MGVPGYFAQARNSCPSSVVKGNNDFVPKFDDLYVDFNCLVHGSVPMSINNEESAEDAILKATIKNLECVIEDVSPARAVYVCTDGVPPEAKMVQQRNRRMMAVLERSYKGNGRQAFDRNMITPGTVFMDTLNNHMRRETDKLGAKYNIKVYYSGSDEPGEGEQKIMELIRENIPASDMCIYGLDADLMLLCATLKAQEHPVVPWLCREEKRIEDGMTYVNADKLTSNMAGSKNSHSLWNHVVCSFLCGNDFLTPLSCLNVLRETRWLQRLKNICNRMGLRLVEDSGDSIRWEDFRELLGRLADDEDIDFRHADNDYWSTPSPPTVDTDGHWDNYPITHRNEAHRSIRPGESEWRARYYAVLFGLRNPSGINRISGEYLRGIQWTFDYYRGAFPPSAPAPAWHYPYTYGPTSLDLYNTVAVGSGRPPQADLSNLPLHIIHPDVLLLFVTPTGSASILPGGQDQANIRTPRHLFPSKCAITTYLHRKVWHCRAVLPHGVPNRVNTT